MEKKDSLQRKSEVVIAKIDCVLRKEPQKLAAINKGKEGRDILRELSTTKLRNGLPT